MDTLAPWKTRPHVPVPMLVDGTVECRVCGCLVHGMGSTFLRHDGEDRPYAVIPHRLSDRGAVTAARQAARRAAQAIGPLDDPGAFADAVVAALAAEGLLRKRPRTALSG